MTISRGRFVWEGGKLSVSRGSGHFIPLPPFGPLYEGLSKQHVSTQLPQQYGFTPVARSDGLKKGHAEESHEEL
jgi:dihydropyrimidinase